MQGFAISMVYPIMKAIVHKGLDFEHLCRRVSFDSKLLQDVEARIEDEALERLMNEAAEYARDDYFGLHMGRLTEFADLGILGYVMMHSAKVEDALAAYRRYNVIVCSGYNLDWEERGDDVVLRFYQVNSSRISRHCMEDMAAALYQLIARMSGRPVLLRELQFRHQAPADGTAPYVSVFGIEPIFGGADNFMRMNKEIIQAPILYSDPRLRRVFEPVAEEIRDKLNRGRTLSDRVFQWMMTCMPSLLPTLRQTAESFGMSARSLQAKLQEENTSFKDLTAQVRKELAVSYLRRREYSIAEIAYLLHFSEPSAFHSAFKKWTGLTPGEYRANRLTGNMPTGQGA